jgi:hypothetical protein
MTPNYRRTLIKSAFFFYLSAKDLKASAAQDNQEAKALASGV